MGGCQSPPLKTMKEETFDKVLDALSDDFYTIKNVIIHRSGLGHSAVENAIEILLDDGDIERTFVKVTPGRGKASVAYRRVRYE